MNDKNTDVVDALKNRPLLGFGGSILWIGGIVLLFKGRYAWGLGSMVAGGLVNYSLYLDISARKDAREDLEQFNAALDSANAPKSNQKSRLSYKNTYLSGPRNTKSITQPQSSTRDFGKLSRASG